MYNIVMTYECVRLKIALVRDSSYVKIQFNEFTFQGHSTHVQRSASVTKCEKVLAQVLL